MKILAPLTNWSQLVETAVVSLEIVISCLLVLYVKKKIAGTITLWDLVIPLIFLNILQWGNILFAFQITFVFPLVFLCFGLWALTIKDIGKRNLLIILFSLLGAFSSFHGLFISAIFIFFLVVEALLNRFRQWKISLLTIIAEILVIAAYFWGYEKKFQTALSLKPNFATLDFFTAALANGYFFHAEVSGNYGLRYILAVITASFLFYGIYKIIVSKERNSLANWVGVLLILYTFLFALSITLGRSAFGLGQASETRYITFFMLAPLGVYFIAEGLKKRNIAKVILLALLLAGFFSYPEGVGLSARVASKARNKAARCYQAKKIEEYSSCFKIVPLYPSETQLHSLMPRVLEYKKLDKK